MEMKIPLAVLRYEPNGVVVMQPQFFKKEELKFANLDEVRQECEKRFKRLIETSLRNNEVLPTVVTKEQFLKDKKFNEDFKSALWLDIDVKIEKKSSYFPSIVKGSGILVNILALVGNSISTLLGIRLATENTSAPTQWAVGIGAAVLNFIILLMMYVFSGASDMLKGLGEKIQQLGKKTSRFEMQLKEDPSNKTCCTSTYKKIGVGLGTATAIGALGVITGINNYQDVYSKGLRFNLGPDSAEFKLVIVLAWFSTVTYVVNSLVFQGSFAKALVDYVGSSNQNGILTFAAEQDEAAPLLADTDNSAASGSARYDTHVNMADQDVIGGPSGSSR
jgi:hypothetical protein